MTCNPLEKQVQLNLDHGSWVPHTSESSLGPDHDPCVVSLLSERRSRTTGKVGEQWEGSDPVASPTSATLGPGPVPGRFEGVRVTGPVLRDGRPPPCPVEVPTPLRPCSGRAGTTTCRGNYPSVARQSHVTGEDNRGPVGTDSRRPGGGDGCRRTVQEGPTQ